MTLELGSQSGVSYVCSTDILPGAELCSTSVDTSIDSGGDAASDPALGSVTEPATRDTLHVIHLKRMPETGSCIFNFLLMRIVVFFERKITLQ